MTDYVIADLHLFDTGIITYEARPFKNIDEYHTVLVDNWNKVVGNDDTVYVLGDVGPVGMCGVDELHEIVSKLNGHKILILGNHDREYKFTDEDWKFIGFEKIYDIPVVYNGFMILSHEPMYVSTQAPFVNIYGHVHGNPNYKFVSKCGACVCVERINYRPISMNKIKELIREEIDN